MSSNNYHDYGIFLKRIRDLQGENSKQQPDIQENEPNQTQIEKKQKFQQGRNRNQIQVQYYSFFQDVASLLQSFRLEDLPPQVFTSHRIKLISDENNRLQKKLLTGSLSYVQLVNSSNNGLQCYYNVLIGRFFLTVKVLNLHFNSQIETYDNQFLGEGSYGRVKRLKIQNKQIAIKKIVFPKKKILKIDTNNLLNNQDFADVFEIRKAISQYCLYKICSMLKIGPQVIFENTYDLVCYNNCIEFQMELCKQIDKKIDIDAYEKDLKRCLGILHSVKIIHKDIKKSNTLYSPAFSSYILSDFGLTHPIKQSLWEKTQTYFAGSLSQACDEMKKLFYNSESGAVNLYLNDLHCLKVTVEHMRSEQKIHEQQYSKNSMSIGKHVYDYDEDQSCCEYISSQEEYSRSSSNQDGMGVVVRGFVKNQQTEQNQIPKDTINYYFIKALFEFLRGHKDRQNLKQFEAIKQIIRRVIKNEPCFEKMRYELEKMAGVIISSNLSDDKFQLSNIRNSIRMFGTNSEEVLQLLTEICGKRTICALNYSKIENYLAVSNKKNKVVIKKFQNPILNMQRHAVLHNIKSVVSSLRNQIRHYLQAKEHKDEEKKEIFLFGIQVLSYQELTQEQNIELIVMLWQILFNKQIQPSKVNSTDCLYLVDQIFLWFSDASFDQFIMMLINLIQIHLKYNSTESAHQYLNKVAESRKKLIQKLTSSLDMTQENKKQMQLEIIRFNQAEVHYYCVKNQFERALQLSKINYIKFTEYQLMDDSMRITILSNLIQSLIALGQFEQAEKRLPQLEAVVEKVCFPRKNCVEFAFCHFFRANCCFANGNIEKAIEYYYISIQCSNDSLRGPNHVHLIKQSLQNLSNCYQHLKEIDKSIACLENALELSLTYGQFNNYAEAINLTQKIISELVRSNQLNSRIKRYTDQLVFFQYSFIARADQATPTGLLGMMDYFDIDGLMNLDNRSKIFMCKQLIASAKPYLPAFVESCKRLCRILVCLLKQQNQEAKTIPYFGMMFKWTSKQKLFGTNTQYIQQYGQILTKQDKSFLYANFLKKIVHLIPTEYQEYKTLIYNWLRNQTKYIKNSEKNYYNFIWTYRAFINIDNLNQAENNLDYLNHSIFVKNIWKKKLAQLKNTLLPEQPLPKVGTCKKLNPEIPAEQQLKPESAENMIKQKLRSKFKRIRNKEEKKMEEQKPLN